MSLRQDPHLMITIHIYNATQYPTVTLGVKFLDALTSWNVIKSPVEIICNRKVNLTDASIQVNIGDRLNKLCDQYKDIFSKHSTDIGKTDLVQMALMPQDNIKTSDQRPYILPIKHYACFRKN